MELLAIENIAAFLHNLYTLLSEHVYGSLYSERSCECIDAFQGQIFGSTFGKPIDLFGSYHYLTPPPPPFFPIVGKCQEIPRDMLGAKFLQCVNDPQQILCIVSSLDQTDFY